MKCPGDRISNGVACGKAKFLKTVDFNLFDEDKSNQEVVFLTAIDTVSKQLELQILDAEKNNLREISEIFEAHQYIVNDPIVKNSTINKIRSGISAKQAYTESIQFVLAQFETIENEYMLGRIVDIIDATDKVKVALNSVEEKVIFDFHEDTILILDQLKPSIVYSAHQYNVVGFIAEKGYYSQHSGIIARAINMPGMVCKEIFQKIKEDDYIILDSINGYIFINPEKKIIEQYSRRLTDEL